VACFAPGTSWRRRGAGFRRGRFVNAAREQSHAIELALAGFAHDIRTPLTGILALSQLLQAMICPSASEAGPKRSGAPPIIWRG
jgi:signal transduction histidine kinase